MDGAVPLLSLQAFVGWTGKNFVLTTFKQKHGQLDVYLMETNYVKMRLWPKCEAS
jgi:hypothetical protein